MEKYIFSSKFCNEETYKHNGEEVKILELNGCFATIEFNDGTTATVYENELKSI